MIRLKLVDVLQGVVVTLRLLFVHFILDLLHLFIQSVESISVIFQIFCNLKDQDRSADFSLSLAQNLQQTRGSEKKTTGTYYF